MVDFPLMATAQPGIFAQGTRTHRHLEFDLLPGVQAADVAAAIEPFRTPSVTAGGSNIVVGFGPALWRALLPAQCPAGLADLQVASVPSTPHDLWVWLHGTGDDELFAVSRVVGAMLAPIAVLRSEVHGFVYRDSRDLTGFIDGTENPPLEESASVALIADGPGAGGSIALVQRWVHDLASFEQLPVEEQERVIGRTKPDSVELDEEHKPPTAHIARVVMENEAGQELEIYRRSVPYGSVDQHGLVFVAFTHDQARVVAMLEHMFGLADDGLRDRLTDFSRPVTGAFYFVPSIEDLAAALS